MHILIQYVLRTQKPTEGTDLKHPTTLGANQMAQVTYRGVKYNTNDQKSQHSNKVELVYRGVKLEKDLNLAVK